MQKQDPSQEERLPSVDLIKVAAEAELPTWAKREVLARFFHETMKPWHDTLEDVDRALDYARGDQPGTGGFVVLAQSGGELVGALTMLDTGMGGYVPKHLLLFVSVAPELRGRSVGRQIVERAIAECDGQVKLHVEYDNPAKRLYERIGFTTKYAEMRYVRS